MKCIVECARTCYSGTNNNYKEKVCDTGATGKTTFLHLYCGHVRMLKLAALPDLRYVDSAVEPAHVLVVRQTTVIFKRSGIIDEVHIRNEIIWLAVYCHSNQTHRLEVADL
uniref:Uncharacterized protein n=1 Tax=Ascaris lumbricoides TaxID=6252 RepID=A0A0M3IIG3_ASCLU